MKALNTFLQTSQADSADYWMYVSGIASNIYYELYNLLHYANIIQGKFTRFNIDITYVISAGLVKYKR